MNRELIIPITIWLVAILNPISALPYYMLSNPQSDVNQAKKDAKIMAFAALLIMFIWWFLGMELLGFFGLEMRYFRIAGWILIAYNAFRMVTGNMPAGHHESWSQVSDIDNRWLIVPLTMPLVAGPGSLAYLIWWFGYGSEFYLALGIAICIGTLLFYLIIRYSVYLERRLGDLGITIVTRFMGLILLGIGIQMILINL